MWRKVAERYDKLQERTPINCTAGLLQKVSHPRMSAFGQRPTCVERPKLGWEGDIISGDI